MIVAIGYVIIHEGEYKRQQIQKHIISEPFTASVMEWTLVHC